MMVTIKKIGLLCILIVGLQFKLFGVTTDDILSKLHEAQLRITDMSAVYSQSVSSPLFGKEPQVEKGRFYKKGPLSRREIQRPTRKLVITTDRFVFEKDEETGHSKKTDLSGLPTPTMTPEEAIKQYHFTLTQETPEFYSLVGKNGDSEMEMLVNKNRWTVDTLSVRMKGTPMITIHNDYDVIDSIPVLVKSVSEMQFSVGQTTNRIQTEMTYKSVKINQNLSPSLFSLDTL